MNTTFTVLSVEHSDGETGDWPDTTDTITSLVEGELADQVRARSGKEGDVTLTEHRVDGGWSEYTQEDDWTFTIRVGGDVAWDSGWPDYRSLLDHRGAAAGGRCQPNRSDRLSGLGKLLAWVEGVVA